MTSSMQETQTLRECKSNELCGTFELALVFIIFDGFLWLFHGSGVT